MKIDVDIDYLSDESSNDHYDDDITDNDYLTDDMPSDEDNTANHLKNFCKHPKKLLNSAHWTNGIKHVGQIFYGVRQFRKELRKYSAEIGFEYVIKKNDLSRVTVCCAYKVEKGFKWHVHARHDKVHEYFIIRELDNTHSCGYLSRKLKNRRMSCHIVADKIKDYLNGTRLLSSKDVGAEIKLDYGLDISYTQAWHTVEIAKDEFYGSHVSSYDQLRWLCQSTTEANPKTKLSVDFDPSNKNFQRLFVAYGPCIEGFNYCRPLLFLDGTFLKSRYKGTLLAATGKDANNGLYSHAIAIVDNENEDN